MRFLLSSCLLLLFGPQAAITCFLNHPVITCLENVILGLIYRLMDFSNVHHGLVMLLSFDCIS